MPSNFKTNTMKKLLIIYRLYNPTYGDAGNPHTLAVNLREDNTLSYTFYSGWQHSGMGQAVGNYQMRKSLPMGARNFKNVKELDREVRSCLATGCGSNHIKSSEILNDL